MSPRFACADRRALLAGTALASTLLIGSLLTPTPAAAIACTQPPSPNPISTVSVTDPIVCVNTEPRTGVGVDAIFLQTVGGGHFIDLYNSGTLNTTGLGAHGMFTQTYGQDAFIHIVNVAGIATTGQQSYGIEAISAAGRGIGGAGGTGGNATAGNGTNANRRH